MVLAATDRQGFIDLLRKDIPGFNAARKALPAETRLDLSGADLSGLDLTKAHIGTCDLSRANLAAATATLFRPYLRAIATGTPPPPMPQRKD